MIHVILYIYIIDYCRQMFYIIFIYIIYIYISLSIHIYDGFTDVFRIACTLLGFGIVP